MDPTSQVQETSCLVFFCDINTDIWLFFLQPQQDFSACRWSVAKKRRSKRVEKKQKQTKSAEAKERNRTKSTM